MSPGYTEPEDMQPDVADVIEYLRTRIATLEAEQDKARRVIEGLNQTVIGTLQERDEARAHIENGDAFRDAVKLACDERLQESKHEIRRLTAERDEARASAAEWKKRAFGRVFIFPDKFDPEGIAATARAQAFAECEEIARAVAAEYDGAAQRYGLRAATDIADDIARATLGTGEK